MVYLLLAFGAVVMARSRDGWTGLMSAAYNGNVLVAKALLATGSDINAKNKVRVTYIPTYLLKHANDFISQLASPLSLFHYSMLSISFACLLFQCLTVLTKIIDQTSMIMTAILLNHSMASQPYTWQHGEATLALWRCWSKKEPMLLPPPL